MRLNKQKYIKSFSGVILENKNHKRNDKILKHIDFSVTYKVY